MDDMSVGLLAVGLLYGGFIGAAIGLASIIRPLRFLGIRSRKLAAGVLLAAASVIVAGMLMPAPLERADGVRTDLDRAMPAWQFRERHRVRVEAPPAEVYRALGAVTADDSFLFRTLTWIRSPHFSTPARETILTPGTGKPILDVMRSGFLPMSEDPGREVVFATVFYTLPQPRLGDRSPEHFIALSSPGFAKVTVNFRVEPAGRGASELTTETRVFATDARSARVFTAYWRVIYPGSALIRISWLRAIKKRAEARTDSATRPHA